MRHLAELHLDLVDGEPRRPGGLGARRRGDRPAGLAAQPQAALERGEHAGQSLRKEQHHPMKRGDGDLPEREAVAQARWSARR